MATRQQGKIAQKAKPAEMGKIALLVGIIVVALGVPAFAYYRSVISQSGSVSSEVKQMMPTARARKQ